MTDTAAPSGKTDLDDFLGVEPPSRRAKMLKWGAIAVALILVALLLSKCVFGKAEAVSYATQTIRRGDLTVSVSATGNLQPTNQVDVGSEQSGLIESVLVQNNDRVSKGQLLARLDLSRLQDAVTQNEAQLAAAQASVAQARATADQSRANYARLQQVFKLSGGKVPSATELDTGRADLARAVATVASAQASVAQARAQLSSNRTNLSKGSIYSPVTGVVLSRQIEPGQTVAASLNAPTLFTIAEDLSRMELQVKVDEADVGQVKEGQRATFTVDAFPGREFPAVITRVDVGANATKAVTSTGSSTSTTTAANSVVAYTAILTLDNPGGILRPGMTATADITTAEKQNVLLVPNAALRFTPNGGPGAGGGQRGGITAVLAPPRRSRRGGGGGADGKGATIARGSRQSIYLLGADGQPQRVRVTAGDTDGSMTEVSGPDVKEGLKVITGQLAAGETQATADTGARSGDGQGRRPRAEGDGATARPAASATPAAPPVSGDSGRKPAIPARQPAGMPDAPRGPAAPAPASGDDAARAERRARFQTMTPEERAARRARWEAEHPGENWEDRPRRRRPEGAGDAAAPNG